MSTKNSKCLDFFRAGPSQIAMIQNTSFSITLFQKPKDSIGMDIPMSIYSPVKKKKEKGNNP